MTRYGGSSADLSEEHPTYVTGQGAARPDLEQLPSVASVAAVAAALDLSTSAVYEAVMRGELPAVRIGRRVLFVKSVLVEFLRSSAESSIRSPGKARKP